MYWCSIISNENHERLCKDGLFRGFANIGTENWCLKMYKTKGWAHRKINELAHKAPGKQFTATHLYAGDTIFADGRIRRRAETECRV